MIELKTDNLKEIISENRKVIVQYGASWCGVCRVVKPRFDALSQETKDVSFIYVDAEEHPNSRELADIQNLPTFAGFVDGKLIYQKAGGNEAAIKEVLNEIAGH